MTAAPLSRRLPRRSDLGFSLALRHGRRSLRLAVPAGLGFGVFMALADAGPLREAVPAIQNQMLVQMTVAERLVRFSFGALRDEVLLRLCAVPALLWLGALLRGRADVAVWWGAIAAAALIVWPLAASGYLAGVRLEALPVLREVVLHGGAGLLWGWLCWRHGWLAGLAGHVSAHLALQPLLTILA